MIGIRPGTMEDLPALAPFFRDFFNLHKQMLGQEESLDDADGERIARSALEKAGSRTLVAQREETGQLLGFARWEEREGAFFGCELYVVPEFRSQGIGRRLIEEVERQVRAAGGRAFFVNIVPQNRRMLAFVHRQGYDTLNTLELRKDLAEARSRRGQVRIFGIDFHII